MEITMFYFRAINKNFEDFEYWAEKDEAEKIKTFLFFSSTTRVKFKNTRNEFVTLFADAIKPNYAILYELRTEKTLTNLTQKL